MESNALRNYNGSTVFMHMDKFEKVELSHAYKMQRSSSSSGIMIVHCVHHATDRYRYTRWHNNH
jgi:hypothetical protein